MKNLHARILQDPHKQELSMEFYSTTELSVATQFPVVQPALKVVGATLVE